MSADALPVRVQAALAGLFEDWWGSVEYNWRLPVSSDYGYRTHPTTGEVHKHHDGLDIAIPVGTPILSIWAGTVHRVDQDGIGRGQYNGNAVLIQSGPWLVAYAHLSRVDVEVGQKVKWGQVIGLSGNTGRSTGPHLHLQVYLEGKTMDPRILYPGKLFFDGG